MHNRPIGSLSAWLTFFPIQPTLSYPFLSFFFRQIFGSLVKIVIERISYLTLVLVSFIIIFNTKTEFSDAKSANVRDWESVRTPRMIVCHAQSTSSLTTPQANGAAAESDSVNMPTCQKQAMIPSGKIYKSFPVLLKRSHWRYRSLTTLWT